MIRTLSESIPHQVKDRKGKEEKEENQRFCPTFLCKATLQVRERTSRKARAPNFCVLWGMFLLFPSLPSRIFSLLHPPSLPLSPSLLFLRWADGQRLGKNETGLVAPIEASTNAGGKAGLGFSSSSSSSYLPNPSLSYLSIQRKKGEGEGERERGGEGRFVSLITKRYAENGRRALQARYEQTK